jgi:hypothetical protein
MIKINILIKEIELILLPVGVAGAEGWTPTGAKRPSRTLQHGQGSPSVNGPPGLSGLINSCIVIWHRSCFAEGVCEELVADEFMFDE